MKHTALALLALTASIGAAQADRVTSIDLGVISSRSITFPPTVFPAGTYLDPFKVYLYFGVPGGQTVTVRASEQGVDPVQQIVGGGLQFGVAAYYLDPPVGPMIPGGPLIDAAAWNGDGSLTETLPGGSYWTEISGASGGDFNVTVSAAPIESVSLSFRPDIAVSAPEAPTWVLLLGGFALVAQWRRNSKSNSVRIRTR